MSRAERFRRVDELFRGACRLDPPERARFLDEHCAGDEALGSEVAALLSEDSGAEGFLATPALGGLLSPADFAGRAPVGAEMPERIGPYRIVRVLGEGGMGVVYEAEQSNPKRAVALKVIRSDLTSPAVLRRFELEAQVLGRLRHPGIAQVYEAGAAESDGKRRLFFAMELVRGLVLNEYAESKRLGLRERLSLFALVCDAVQHAHQSGVIHRDLKPGNILVDDGGQPRVLDFGVARAVDPDLRVTRQTHVGQIVGTVPYMSPEQAAGDPGEIDTRSDVYSLGVVLFELIAGRLPYDVETVPFFEAVRTIREREPMRPSTIDRRLRGDVETIVCKALEKEKDRRYQTSAEFGADIRRFLVHEPILARPATAGYQLRKFARRHTGLVVGLAACLAVLVGGVVGIGVALRRAVDAQHRAETQASITQAVNDFVNDDLLSAADPSIGGRDMTVRAALDRASSRVGERFADRPLVDAAVRATIGRTYWSLGELDKAEEHLVRALEIRQARLGAQDPATLESMSDLGYLRRSQSRFDEGAALFERVYLARTAALGARDKATLEAATSLADIETDRGGYERAERLLTDALAVARPSLGEDYEVTLAAEELLAAVYYKTRKDGAAVSEPLYAHVAAVRRRTLGKNHLDTLAAEASLALVMQTQGKLAEAEPLSRAAFEGYREALGESHQNTLTAQNNLALLYLSLERFAEATATMQKVLEIRRGTLGEDNLDTLVSMAILARAYRVQKRYDDAEALAVPGCTKMLQLLGPDHNYSRIAVTGLARIYDEWGKPEQAAEWLQKIGAPRPDAGAAREK